MRPFTVHTGIVALLDRADIDTDQIIPKQFLKRVERAGYGQFLFNDWRFDAAGEPRADFALNLPRAQGASVLVAGRNFGCGSSREHAAWAILDCGFRAVIAPSFADIFRQNADQNGLLTVALPDDAIDHIVRQAGSDTPYTLTVDLERRVVSDSHGLNVPFEIDDFRRTCLLEGLDRIGLTLKHESAIAAYEARNG